MALVIRLEDLEQSREGVQSSEPGGRFERLPTIADVREQAKAKGIDPELAASIFTQESGANPRVRPSKKGAVGGMQVMPGTFKMVMGNEGDINDAWDNLEAGLRYIEYGQKKVGNDPKLLAAGYHQGYDRPELARGVIADTSDGQMRTRDYARQVAARLGTKGLSIVPPTSTDGEGRFQAWYAEQAKKLDLDPNPDAPEHHYDYRAAYRAGAKPGADGHWPSQFKTADHPNRFVDGVDTITGERADPQDVFVSRLANDGLRLSSPTRPSDGTGPGAESSAKPDAPGVTGWVKGEYGRQKGNLKIGWNNLLQSYHGYMASEFGELAEAFKSKYTPEQVAANPALKAEQDAREANFTAHMSAVQKLGAENNALQELARPATRKFLAAGNDAVQSWGDSENFLKQLKAVGGALVDNPVGVITDLGIQSSISSLAMMASAIAARIGLRNTTATALGGGTGSTMIEFGQDYAKLREEGKTHDDAWKTAMARAPIVGAFDAVSFKSAGTALEKVLAAGAAGKVGIVAKEVGKQAGLGMAGEGLGTSASGRVPQPADVIAEGVGEVFGAPGEALTTFRRKAAGGESAATSGGGSGPAGRRGLNLDSDTGAIDADYIFGAPEARIRSTPAAGTPAAASDAAEKALHKRTDLTVLDQVDRLDEKIGSLAAKQDAANPDPAVAAEIGKLQSERDAIAQDFPKFTVGRESDFQTESGATLKSQYALAEADNLVTSHDENLRPNPAYPNELQPRERERAASEVQVSAIVQKLNPARLGESADSANGAPIVGADGLVESGNARSIALKRTYMANGQKAADYKAWLADNADKFGLTADQVNELERPVLVRIRRTPVNRAEFARQANAPTTATMSPVEQARADAKRIDSLDDVVVGERGEIPLNKNAGFVKRFIGSLPLTEQAALVSGSGELSQSGVARIRNAVLGRAYGESPALLRMVESLDNNLRNITSALVRVAPMVAQARDSIAAGALHDADITADLVAAVEELSRIRERGQSVAEVLAQSQMFGLTLTPEGVELLQFLDSNMRYPNKVARFVENYLTALGAAGSPAQSAMFDAGATPQKGDILKAAKERLDREESPSAVPGSEGSQPEPVADGSDAGQGGSDQGGAGAPAAAEAVEVPEGGGSDQEGAGPSVDEKAAAQAEFDAALGELGELLEQRMPKAAMLPDGERKRLLPVLTKLFTAAAKLGYVKFKEAGAYVVKAINANDTLRELTQWLTEDDYKEAFELSKAERAAAPKPNDTNPIKLNTTLTGKAAKVHAKFRDWVWKNKDKAIAQYQAANGNLINTDEARKLSPDYNASPESRSMYANAVHEPASWLMRQLYEKMLAEPAKPGQRAAVLFLSGGAGAGKTSGMMSIGDTREIAQSAQIVWDSNMAVVAGGIEKIDLALAAGKEVAVIHVYRDPMVAMLKGVLPRAMNHESADHGRAVPLRTYLSNHTGSNTTVRALNAHYEGDARVGFLVVDNSKGVGQESIVPIEELPVLDYNESDLKKFEAAVEKEYRNGRISQALYEGTLGRKPATRSEQGALAGLDEGDRQEDRQENAADPAAGGLDAPRHASDGPDRPAGQEPGATPESEAEGRPGRVRRGPGSGNLVDDQREPASGEGAGEVGRQPGDAGGESEHREAGDNGTGPRGSARIPERRIPAKSGANWRAGDDELTYEGSWLDKAKQNLEAVRLVKQLEAEGRQATPDEQKVLARYVGWGASAIRNQVFRPDTHKLKPGWLAVRNELEDLLTESEWKDASRSTQYAHYTSKAVVRSIWSAVDRLGFKGGAILEPGAGIGVFPGLMPGDLAAQSTYTGIEFEPITGAILKHLFPDERILVESFVDSRLPRNFYDVAIGNPPFSGTAILSDVEYRKHHFALHDYFFAKTIDRVRPGGLVVFVTSRYTMDKLDDKARAYLAERANLLGAIRLPQTAFMKNAGTEVVTDILFLQKLTPEQIQARKDPSYMDPMQKAWGRLQEVQTPEGPALINEYFSDHPAMVLGRNSLKGTMYSKNEYTVLPPEDDIEALFAQAVDRLPKDAFNAARGSAAEQAKVDSIDFDPRANKEGSFYVQDSERLMIVQGGVGIPAKVKEGNKGEGFTQTQLTVMRSFVKLRDALKAAHYDQLNDGDWKASVAKLKQEYERFVAKHGRVNQFKTYERENKDKEVYEYRRSPIIDIIDEDPDYTLVMALEKINEETGEISPSAFLTDRVLNPPKRREVLSASDALLASLDDYGKVNLPEMAKMIGIEEADLVASLGTAIYEDPSAGWVTRDEYLSGDVKEKLQAAEEAVKNDARFERNIEALNSAQPVPVPPSAITATIGMNWIEPADYAAFIKETAGVTAKLKYTAETNTWNLEATAGYATPRATQDFGTTRMGAADILEKLLNSRQIKIFDTVRSPGQADKRVLNAAETEAANERAGRLRAAFATWLWSDGHRADRYGALYNERFNRIVPRVFDGKHLTLPGTSAKWKVHDHVKRGAWRIIQTGNTYLAHAVGAGKTFAMIASAMEQKRLGLITKPMFVVPNHMLQQFAREFIDLYPTAQIMVADEKQFHTERRRQFVARAALSNLDGIIITHSAFKLLDLDPAFKKKVIERELEYFRLALIDAGGDPTKMGQSRDPKIRNIEASIERLEEKLTAAASAGAKDQNVRFDEIGADFLYVDEAHEFRKVAFPTNRQIKGIDSSGSDRAFDLYMKSRFLEEKNPGRSMVMASGTPVTNTLAELYTVQRFMDEARLEAAGLRDFDAWASQFGEEVTNIEADASGRYLPVTRFAKFVNVPELTQMFREFADVLTSGELARLLPDTRPKVKGGSRQIIVTPETPEMRRYKAELATRLEISRKWKPSRDEPYNPDPVIRIIGDGRLASIDHRFVNPIFPSNPDSKLNMLIAGVLKAYKDTKDLVYIGKDGKPEPLKGATQMVFSDLGFGEGVTERRGFDARAWFKRTLVDGGVDPSHIAFMADYKKSEKKLKLFQDVNAGRVRILVGSSKNMGTGVNAQRRLLKESHLDTPWYPADLEQREGRIIRQGNLNPIVEIDAYSAKGSYDSVMWQMVASKQRFIDQALSGESSVRTLDDLSETSNFEMATALTAGDERAIQLAGLRADIQRFERLESAHYDGQARYAREVEQAKATAQRRAKALKEAIPAAEKVQDLAGDKFTMKVGDAEYTERAKAGEALIARFKELAAKVTDGVKTVGSISGFDVVFGGRIERDNKQAVVGYQAAIGLMLGDQITPLFSRPDASPVGITMTMTNELGRLRGLPDVLRSQIKDAEDTVKSLEPRLNTPFEFKALLAEKRKEADALELAMAAAPAPDLATDPDDGEAPKASRVHSWMVESGEFAGVSKAEVQRIVDGVKKAVRNIASGGVHVVEYADQLPPRLRNYLLSQNAMDGTEGLFDADTLSIYLIANNIDSKERAQFVIFHELFGHYGLRGVFGDRLNAALQEVWTKNANVRKEAAELSRKFGYKQLLATEEALANMAGRGEQITGFGAFMAKVQRALREMGFGYVADLLERMTDAEALAMLAQARAFVTGGKDPHIYGGDLAIARSAEAAPAWYSDLHRKIADIKQGSAPAGQWKAIIENLAQKGVKRDEVEATGVMEWLGTQGGKITKEALLDYLAANGVQVREVLLGAGKVKIDTASIAAFLDKAEDDEDSDVDPDALGDARAALAKLDRGGDVLGAIGDLETAGVPYAVLEAAGVYSEDVPMDRAPRHARWQLPGGANYKELLLTLPVSAQGSRGWQDYRDEMHSRGITVHAADEVRRHLLGAPEDTIDMPQALAAERTMGADFVKRYSEVLMDKTRRRVSETTFINPHHYNEPNVLAHVRFNERTGADGKRVLFLEEIQSDWAQEGRERGFAKKPQLQSFEEWAKDNVGGTPTAADRRRYARYVELGDPVTGSITKQVPSAPFVTKTEAWVGLVLRRMIRYAAEHGFDSVAWTTGEQQVERYAEGLRNEVDIIRWTKTPKGIHIVGFKGKAVTGKEVAIGLRDQIAAIDQRIDTLIGERAVDDLHRDESSVLRELMADRRGMAEELQNVGNRPAGRKVVDTTESETALSDAIGKAMAQKIIQDPNQAGEIVGKDITISDSGMATFYQRIVPNVANGILKKIGGGRVSEREVNIIEPDLGAGREQRIRQEGQSYVDGMDETHGSPDSDGWNELGGPYKTRAEAEEVIKDLTSLSAQPGFDITPAMRDAAMAGMPVFSRQVQVDSPAFRRWFGRSKVVDPAGNPLVVKHATEGSFDVFKPVAIATRSPDVGFHFGTDEQADHAIRDQRREKKGGDKYREGANVMPVYLSIEDPLRVEDADWTLEPLMFASQLHKAGIITEDEFKTVDPERYKTPWNPKRDGGDPFQQRARLIAVLEAKGHDGLVYENTHEGPGDSWVAFHPQQVKSAIGNRGTFDESSSSIVLSQKQTPEQAANAKLADKPTTFRPLEVVTKGVTKALRVDRLTSYAYDKLLQLIGALVPEKVKAGVVSDYGIPEAVIDRRVGMQGSVRKHLRQVEQVLEALAGLTRAESRVAYEWMNSDRPDAADYFREQLPPESIAVLADVEKMIEQMSQEAVRLGQLSPDVYQRNRFAYLRRSYVKHTAELTAQEKATKSRSIAVFGDQYKGRGISDGVEMSKVQNIAPEFWKRKLQAGKADKGLLGEKFIRLERRDPAPGAGVAPIQGIGPAQAGPGRLREVIYWPADEAIPSRYASWERAGPPWEVRGTKGSKLIVWRDFTKAERVSMGEIDEVKYAVARTLHGMIHDVEVGRYLEWLANTHARPDDKNIPKEKIIEAKDSLFHTFGLDEWVKVPATEIPGTSTARYGKLADLFVPGPIWNDIRQTVGQNYQPLGEYYATVLRAWKVSKTALSPAVHMNNVMANMVMADWHDVGAAHIGKALDILIHSKDPANKIIVERFEDAGGTIGSFSVSELQREQLAPLIEQLKRDMGGPAGLVGAGAAIQLAVSGKYREALAALASSKVARGGAAIGNAMIDLYQSEDVVFRLAVFLRAKEAGLPDIAAGKAARKSFLDYNINAPWIQMMRQTAFPFISFTYRAAPMLLEIAARKPWKLLKLGLFAGALNAIGYAMSGGDEDKERKLLPDEKRGRVWGFLVPKLIRMPWNDSHGSPVFLDIRRWIPVGDVFDLGQSHSAVPVIPMVVPGGPLAVLAEILFNKSQFTGRDITKDTDKPLERAVKVFDHLYKALAPNIVGLPGTYATKGVVDAATGRTDAFGREQSTTQALLSSVGVKVGAYPADVAAKNLKSQRDRALREIGETVTGLKRELARKGISQADFEKKLAEQNAKREKVNRDYAAKLN